MSLFGPKRWSIGDHRVEKKKRRVPGTAVHGDIRGVTARTKTYYRCVDCEKQFKDRDKFKSEDCYEVI